MAKSKIVSVNKKISEKVGTTFAKIQDSVVGGYTKIEDAFIDHYLKRDGETIAQAKNRFKQKQSK